MSPEKTKDMNFCISEIIHFSATLDKTIDEDFVRSEISRSWKIKDVDWGAWDTYAAFRFLASHFEHYSSVSGKFLFVCAVRRSIFQPPSIFLVVLISKIFP